MSLEGHSCITRLSSSLSSTAPLLYVELLGDNTASFTFGELPDVLFDDVVMLKGFGVGDVFCFGDRWVFLLCMVSGVALRALDVFVIDTLAGSLGVDVDEP